MDLNARQIESLASIRDIYGDGVLYAMDCSADYHLDEILDLGISDYTVLRDRLTEKLGIKGPLAEEPAPGCTVFTAKNKAGHMLVGRNYDFRDRRKAPAMMLLKTIGDGRGRSLAMSNLSYLDLTPQKLRPE